MIIWSHRGHPGPENTLQAFTAAWEDGITHFETDIHATLDGHLVLAHDPSILRLTQVDQQISTLTLEQLQEFPINGQHPWCTLEELVTRFPDAHISIDIKSDDTLHPFIEWIEDRHAANFVVGSFSSKRVQSFRQAHPSVRTALTPLETLALVFGLDRFIKWDESEDEEWLLLIYIKNNSPDEGIVIEDKTNPEKNISHEFKNNEIFKASDTMVDSLTQLIARKRAKNNN